MGKSNEIYLRDSFINPNVAYLFNTEIVEYDMKEAGFSLVQEYELLPKTVIEDLKKIPKEQRKIEIGNLQRQSDKLKSDLKTAFALARERFFDLNVLDKEDIISIKKDAIFTTKKCNIQEIGDYIVFRPKNTYTSYIHMYTHLEFYYNPTTLDIKGIGDEKLVYHEDYMIKFLKNFFHKMETEDPIKVIEYTKRFIDKYKKMELEVGYYRNFDVKSEFHLKDKSAVFMDYWEDSKEDLDITYNYFNILMKLIKIPL
jgi:hypothetical protein